MWLRIAPSPMSQPSPSHGLGVHRRCCGMQAPWDRLQEKVGIEFLRYAINNYPHIEIPPNKWNNKRKEISGIKETKACVSCPKSQFYIHKIRSLMDFLASRNLFVLKAFSSCFGVKHCTYCFHTCKKMYPYHDTLTQILMSYLVVIFFNGIINIKPFGLLSDELPVCKTPFSYLRTRILLWPLDYRAGRPLSRSLYGYRLVGGWVSGGGDLCKCYIFFF